MSIEALLRLQAWLSPAFPTGGFAYSHGLEWAVESGDVHDESTTREWIADILRYGSGRNDAILLRHAMRAGDIAALTELCELAASLPASKERRTETLAQGTAFASAARIWGGARLVALGETQVSYPVALGALASDQGIDEDSLVAAWLQSFAANLISAAVRLVPLGQTAGLRVLAALETVLLAVVDETRAATLDDLGGACFRSDIAAMRHETQYTRLFRS